MVDGIGRNDGIRPSGNDSIDNVGGTPQPADVERFESELNVSSADSDARFVAAQREKIKDMTPEEQEAYVKGLSMQDKEIWGRVLDKESKSFEGPGNFFDSLSPAEQQVTFEFTFVRGLVKNATDMMKSAEEGLKDSLNDEG